VRPSDLEEYLLLGHEVTGVEFKGPGARTDRQLMGQVLRAILGMANRRDGGHIVIGVRDADGLLAPDGLNDEQLATWTFDDVADVVANHADPSVRLECHTVHDAHGRAFVVIRVHEFDDVPILCKRNYNEPSNREILRRGACYVRPRRKPETTEIPTFEDMRELLDLASEKQTRRFLARAQSVGCDLELSSTPADTERFAAERERMWND